MTMSICYFILVIASCLLAKVGSFILKFSRFLVSDSSLKTAVHSPLITVPQLAAMNGIRDAYCHDQFRSFVQAKNYSAITHFWQSQIHSESHPTFVTGDDSYGVCNLEAVNAAGHKGEFTSKDYRYLHRKTFAMRVGYDGSRYSGFQTQKNESVLTVEDDIKNILERAVYAAGRTDKGVSAVSQIVSFTTSSTSFDPADLIRKFRSSEAYAARGLTCYECVRVPRSFNSRSSATWRRYLYLMPLAAREASGFDIDVSFVNECLIRLENQTLPFNGFAYHENRKGGEGLQDFCRLFKARAYPVDLAKGAEEEEEASSTSSTRPHSWSSAQPSGTIDVALCVELVGNRFLRQMVRKLVATAVRESLMPVDIRNPNILHDVCMSGNRELCAPALPGEGLCFAGVGYDSGALSFYKMMPKLQAQQLRGALAGNT